MPLSLNYEDWDFDVRFKTYHELMPNKISSILLIASPYDAYILEEDGSLTSKIINEYRGLNLSRPPRLTQVSSAKEALAVLDEKYFDLVITMPHLDDMDTFNLGTKIKEKNPDLPIVLLIHNIPEIDSISEKIETSQIDQFYVWTGDADLLFAIIKNIEDRLNIEPDTQKAMVRVLLLVEDSAFYRSFFLPLMYKEVVHQTQEVLEETLNEEHRLLKMRARPRILVAENYEEAVRLYEKYRDYIFGVISDTRFSMNGMVTPDAGVRLLKKIKKEVFDLPLLLLSSETQNREKAVHIPAQFIDKNSPDLTHQLHEFFLNFLGFGDFVFRTFDGKEVGRASSLKSLERILPKIPSEPLCYHASRNRFSNWIMARSEINLACELRKVKVSDFPDIDSMRNFLVESIHSLRKWGQKGMVTQFGRQDFDPEIFEFTKTGSGSLGGKARGLAFVANLLRNSSFLTKEFPSFNIQIPKTLVITTQGFDDFIELNSLYDIHQQGMTDSEISDRFLKGKMPEWIFEDLKAFITRVFHPLSVRSSSLLEDAHYHPLSGLYKTYMIPNNHPDIFIRLHQLIRAVKLVYASTYFRAPTTFSSSSSSQIRKESMAVIIQQTVGQIFGDYFYPSISGIAQSRNFYPVSPLKPQDGIVRMVVGFGKPLLDEGDGFRFCPKYPSVLPQFSKLNDILANAQSSFYSLNLSLPAEKMMSDQNDDLEPRSIHDASQELPISMLVSTYIHDEQRIRDSNYMEGLKILTYNQLIKYNQFNFPELLDTLLKISHDGLGGGSEFEFVMNMNDTPGKKLDFYILQMRPMSSGEDYLEVSISPSEIERALCHSHHSMGHGRFNSITDIVYVKPESFEVSKTVRIAEEIGKLNHEFLKKKRNYILIGPGRWGSNDRWLGIPVGWRDISSAGVIVELRNEQLKVDPSQGSHFFQKITSLGIPYITITEGESGDIQWNRLGEFPVYYESTYLRWIQKEYPFTVKCDGRKSLCAIFES